MLHHHYLFIASLDFDNQSFHDDNNNYKIIILNLFTLLQLYPLLPHLQEKEEVNVMKSVEEILQ